LIGPIGNSTYINRFISVRVNACIEFWKKTLNPYKKSQSTLQIYFDSF